VVQSGSRVTPDEREIPSTSLRAGSSLRLRNGYARDDAVEFEIQTAPPPEWLPWRVHTKYAYNIIFTMFQLEHFAGFSHPWQASEKLAADAERQPAGAVGVGGLNGTTEVVALPKT
jgi:hypothetical protein